MSESRYPKNAKKGWEGPFAEIFPGSLRIFAVNVDARAVLEVFCLKETGQFTFSSRPLDPAAWRQRDSLPELQTSSPE